MKPLTILVTTALIASASQVSHAGTDSGLYLGASIGNAQLEIDGIDSFIDDSDTGYKVFAGYNFGLLPMVDLAVEASYIDYGTTYGDFQGYQARFDNTALQAHVVGGLNFGPFGLFAKAGVSDWQTKFSDGYHSVEATGSDPAYGIGAKFQLGALQLRTEFERIYLDDAEMEFYSLGAAYTF